MSIETERDGRDLPALLLAGAIIFFLFTALFAFGGGESKADLHPDMSDGEVKAFVTKVAELKRELNAPDYKISEQEVTMWQLEVVPWFEYEKFTDDPKYGNVQFVPMQTAAEHNGILGYASCSTGDVVMNLRMANPRSSWYGEAEFVSTLIHELAHVNGACGHGNIDETVAQLITMEIMAAQVNNGNYQVLDALLDELMDWGLGYLRANAYDHAMNVDGWGLGTDAQSEALQEYWAFHKEVSPETYAATKQRARSRSPQENLSIAWMYRREPFRLIANNFNRGEVTNLPLPRFIEPGVGWRGYQAGEPPLRSLPINDTIYFINHIEEAVAFAIEDASR